jgi:hypothetical protein
VIVHTARSEHALMQHAGCNEHSMMHTGRNQHPMMHTGRNEHSMMQTGRNEHPLVHTGRYEPPMMHTGRNEHPIMHAGRNEHSMMLTMRNEHSMIHTGRNDHPMMHTARNDHVTMHAGRNEHSMLHAGRIEPVIMHAGRNEQEYFYDAAWMKKYTETVEADQTASSSPPPPNRSLADTPALMAGWGAGQGYSRPGGGEGYPRGPAPTYPPMTTVPPYKKQTEDQKEIEDSSSVVSSTQDIERNRYITNGDVPRQYCEEPHRGGRQDHFGSLIGMLSDLQEANCADIDQILAEGSFSPEIKTETCLDNMHLQHQNEVGYHHLPHQDLYPSSYLRQNCNSADIGYSTCREDGSTNSSLQYPTQLPLKVGGYAPLSPDDSKGGPYSPMSPGSPSMKHDRSKDDKYWERRRKNNLAAKKSRDARRVRENQLRLRVLCSENQIRVLRSQLDRSQEENHTLKERLKKYEGDVHIPRMEHYNMAPPPPLPQPGGAELEYNTRQQQTEYIPAGHSGTRNAPKPIEDDLSGMAAT